MFTKRKDWQLFVGAFEENWQRCSFKEELIFALSGHEDLAIVVFGQTGESALGWVHESVPDLGGLTPHECSANSKLNCKLRSTLMKMPC